MNASTGTLAPEITHFAAAVRYALGDLPMDEVDDLTDGLEAELQDRLDDLGPGALGDPDAYADELRSAAGLPPRGPRMPVIEPRVSPWAALTKFPAMVGSEFRALVSRHPALAGLTAFFVALRPLWWIARAAMLYAAVSGLMGWWAFTINPGRLLLFAALLVISIQFGRGRWLPRAWMRVLLTIANVVLVLALPFFVGSVVNSVNNAYYAYNYGGGDSYSPPSDGVYRNGSPVGNLFAYGPDGELIENARLFDQNGDPVEIGSDFGGGSGFLYDSNGQILVPNDDVPGAAGWNVYPLNHVTDSSFTDEGEIDPDARRISPSAPFDQVKPLAGYVPDSEAEPMVPVTPTPTPTPTPAPVP